MKIHVVDLRQPITRRGFLRAPGRALAAALTAITDELARLFRVCSFAAALIGA